MTSITVPTHVGKAKVYVERMTKLLDQEPRLFMLNMSTEDIIRVWEHQEEKNINKKTYDALRKIKEMVNRIAINSKTSYISLVDLAYKSMVTELTEEEAGDLMAITDDFDIETSVETEKATDKLREDLGDKKTAVFILHSQEFNNEDIAKEIFEHGLTTRRISRQAVRGLLKSAEKTTQKHVKTD